MTVSTSDSKGDARQPNGRFITFVDDHPRLGWWIAFWSTFGALLDLLNLFL